MEGSSRTEPEKVVRIHREGTQVWNYHLSSYPTHSQSMTWRFLVLFCETVFNSEKTHAARNTPGHVKRIQL